LELFLVHRYCWWFVFLTIPDSYTRVVASAHDEVLLGLAESFAIFFEEWL
jgi:hypothetical protein